MPRVAFTQYLDRRRELLRAWENRPACFMQLQFHEQCYLHDYFRFAETLTETELRNHWQNLAMQQSSLPQRAGRALVALRHTQVRAPAHRRAKLMGETGASPLNMRYAVEGLTRPQPDREKLATLLLDIVRRGSN